MSDRADDYTSKSPSLNTPPPLSLFESEQNLIGRQLGQYKLLEKIGQGGMGAVFKAYDTALDRAVALKALFASPLEDAKQCERFMREARSLARMSHPNLLHIYNVGHEGDYYYFAMELLSGVTLTQEIRRQNRIPMRETILYIGQLVSALHYIHQHGIIHRDIKSQNIMLCGHRAVLMDFGLAKDNNFSGLTSVGVVLGTPDYISPEAVEGISAGPPTDIYSLGVVMYEMLTGVLPFVGKSALSIIRQHLDVAPPPLKTMLPDIPSLLEKIVLRCMAKKSDERYPNCLALARELLQVYRTPELITLVEDTHNIGADALSAASSSKSSPSALLTPLNPQDAAAELRVALQTQNMNKTVTLNNERETMAMTPNNAPLATNGNAVMATDYATMELKQPISPIAQHWSPWTLAALSVFGVLLLIAIFIVMRQRPSAKQIQKSPILEKSPRSKEWIGQIISMRAPNGNIQKYRWIEFKADDPDPKTWYHIIEPLDSDGKGMRTKIKHDDFIKIADGQLFEFLPSLENHRGY